MTDGAPNRKAMPHHDAICFTATAATTPHLIGPHACSSPQLLVSDDVNVHDDEFLHLSGVTETAERVAPVCVSVHFSN